QCLSRERAAEALLQVGAETIERDDLVSGGDTGLLRRRSLDHRLHLEGPVLILELCAEPGSRPAVLRRRLRLRLGASLVLGSRSRPDQRAQADARECRVELELVGAAQGAVEPR